MHCIHSAWELKNLLRQLKCSGCMHIVGIDEAGRGPLAGPVVAAAVYLPDDCSIWDELRDSKALSPKRREELYRYLKREAHIGIGKASSREIDRLNIRRATLLAMQRALKNLKLVPDFVLIDGDELGELPHQCAWVIKGDRICPQIAAASIVAKVTRDRLMVRAHKRYPEYGFNQHKGYATQLHKQRLVEHGPCPIHRLSYAPVQKALQLKLSNCSVVSQKSL